MYCIVVLAYAMYCDFLLDYTTGTLSVLVLRLFFFLHLCVLFPDLFMGVRQSRAKWLLNSFLYAVKLINMDLTKFGIYDNKGLS